MVAVSGIVNYNGNVLIGKKRSDSPKFLAGKWHIPGETIEGEESDESALVRGMIEEANLEIMVGKYIDTSISPGSKSPVRWYECFSSTDVVNPSSDLEDVLWIQKKKIFDFVLPEVYELWPEKVKKYFLL